MNKTLQMNMFEPCLFVVSPIKLFSLLLSILSNLLLLLILQKNKLYMGTIYNINIPQAADACEGYPVTHYNLTLTRSSDVNQSIFMLGPSRTNDASRVEITLNSTDDILQNVQYHFQISAVNIIGSSNSSGMEFCKSRIVLTCTRYHIKIPPVDAFI